jgi:hypothetical protein
LEIAEQGNGVKYGVLIYDVPQDNPQLYHKVYRKIRRKAIRLNLSVYLILWGMKEELEGVIEEAQQETGQLATVCVLPFDNRSVEDIRIAAKQSLANEIKGIGDRLLTTIVKTKEKMESEGKKFTHIREAYAKQIQQRLEEAEALGVLFGLTHDIEHAIESTQKIFAGELEKIMADNVNKKGRGRPRKKKAAVAETVEEEVIESNEEMAERGVEKEDTVEVEGTEEEKSTGTPTSWSDII